MDEFQELLFDPGVGKVALTIVGVLVVAALVKVAQRITVRRIHNPDVRYRIRKLASLVGYLVAGLFITIVYSERLSGLTVAFGVAGAGIAFALQEVIASAAGWIAVALGGFYHVGDRVQLGGIVGDVIDIGILRTTMMECGQWVKGDLYTGRIVRIANSFVFKEPVFNYSADFPFLWDELTVPVRHDSDRTRTRDILQRVLDETVGDYANEAASEWSSIVKKYRIENARVAPMVTMTADENWLTYTLRYVTDYKARRRTKDLLYARVLNEFDATDGRVRIATASGELSIIEMPSVDATVRQD